jgi:hypothetical protein
MYGMMKTELADFRWGGPVSLLSFHTSGVLAEFLVRLEKFRELKSIDGFPVMAVSKFLHPYNPELFPVYDNAVIKDEVLPALRTEFRAFCVESKLQRVVGNTSTFYASYMCWGSYLLALAHPRFMQAFADWLDKQQASELAARGLDGTRLQATAYEFTIIGAYADSMRG